jgi:tetratricopeptide (TPR) repeat protein
MSKQSLSMVAALLAWGAVLAVAAELSSADKHAVAEANKFIERGNKFVAENSLARAKAEYQKALKIFPRHVDALYNLAVACEKLGQNDEAITHYKRYVELAAHDADAWTQLGLRYEAAGKKAEAQQAYKQALTVNPGYGLAHHNLGVLLQEQGKLDDAQRHLETFVKIEAALQRKNGDAYYSLGALHLARGQVKEAKRLLQQALDVDPSIVYYNNAMGDVYLAEKQPNMALLYYRKALDKDEKYAPAYSGLGEAYHQLGERAKAANAYQKALALRKDYHLVEFKLGLLHEETDPPQAIKYFEKYLASGKNLEFQTEATARIEKLKQAKQK